MRTLFTAIGENKEEQRAKWPYHLVGFCGEFKVWTLDDGIYRACLLAEPAVDALGHINVVPVHSHSTIIQLITQPDGN